MRIRAAAVEGLLAEAQLRRPEEACGLFGGAPGQIDTFYPLPNVDKSPLTYQMDPASILTVLRQMERAGQSLVGIGHSHPATVAEPSATDIRQAHYPQCLYLIVSLRAKTPEVRAFWIDQSSARAEPLTVLADGANTAS